MKSHNSQVINTENHSEFLYQMIDPEQQPKAKEFISLISILKNGFSANFNLINEHDLCSSDSLTFSNLIDVALKTLHTPSTFFNFYRKN